MIEKIIHGNNIEVLKTFPDNYFDSVVTDPPYGISFMGKKWDYDVPNVDTWKEVLRVLKPGGHMLVACGTRTQHRMAVNIEDAGFEIRDIVAWVYGSGFPKSMDVSKAIDKHLGAEREVVGKDEEWIKRVGKNHNESNTYTDKSFGMVGKNGGNITAPSTDEAKKYEGWGTALKPAMELWTLARKPFNSTVAQNVLKHGVGGINIDATRIPLQENETTWANEKGGDYENVLEGFQRKNKSMFANKAPSSGSDLGRFPANFIHDGSEEVEALFPDSDGAGGSMPNSKITGYGKNMGDGTYEYYGGDRKVFESGSGSASRFFYVAKASQEERNFGLYDFEKKYTASAEFRPNHMEKALNGEDGNPYGRWQPKKNIHPTVKPIELMRYLVRMVTPPNGICLDPYLGSGTTAIACEMEKFNYIGIERDEQYVEIAKARVSAVKDYETHLDTKTAIKESIKEDKEKELGIQNIFDFM